MPRSMLPTVLMFASAASVRADEFTFSFHEAAGSGSANLYDGGPVVFDSDSTKAPDDPEMRFLAYDLSQQGGSLGASAIAFGRSEIISSRLWGLLIGIELDVDYTPSFFPGGDRPGGEAEGSLTSTIEFILPAEQVEWGYGFQIDQTAGFEGHAIIVMENVTQSLTLATLTEQTFVDYTLIPGTTGDLIRITAEMTGSGSAPPGVATFRQYEAQLGMNVRIVPEPTTLALLAPALALLPPTWRRRPTSTRRRSTTRRSRWWSTRQRLRGTRPCVSARFLPKRSPTSRATSCIWG